MTIVALTYGDCYLHLATDEHGSVLRGDDAELTDSALFERVELGHGRVALRSPDGRHLAVRPSGAADTGLRLEDDLTACAAFEELTWPDGSVSFRTCDRTFLGVDAEGAVLGDRISSGSCERFEYADVPAELSTSFATVPPQARVVDGVRSPALT